MLEGQLKLVILNKSNSWLILFCEYLTYIPGPLCYIRWLCLNNITIFKPLHLIWKKNGRLFALHSFTISKKIGCLLFPTVENMITSPAGISLNRVLKYVPSLFMMSIVWLISCLPRSFLGKTVKLWLQFKLLNFNSSTPYLTDACLGATLDLINPRYVDS